MKNAPADERSGVADARAGGTELPAKLRVHALAKLLEVRSKDVLTALEALGAEVRSAQSSVSRDLALQVIEKLAPAEEAAGTPSAAAEESAAAAEQPAEDSGPRAAAAPVFAPPQPVFLPPQPAAAPAARQAPAKQAAAKQPQAAEPVEQAVVSPSAPEDVDEDEDAGSRRRRRRGRRGRGRGRGGQDAEGGEEPGDDEDGTPAETAADVVPEAPAEEQAAAEQDGEDTEGEQSEGSRRRRRRRRRKGTAEDDAASRSDDPPNTVVHVRESKPAQVKAEPVVEDEVRSVRGSTRLEAKRQRRRDGREAGRRRVPVLSEAEFLARRESVERRMVVRERGDRTQIAVLEDGVLVEHFVTSSGTGSIVGNVYLGRVQNVLPSMEAAFVDIGRGRNAVLYAGEVDWDAAGLEGKARKIEQALSTGDSVLVQVTKEPVGHKGARLTTQISLPGRFLVYVPGGGATGISRKLPDVERKRLKEILKRIVPDEAGVIIRTASEGTSEESLDRDVRRLRAQWEIIKERAAIPRAQAPQLLYEEPDLLIKVVRDLFTEDFSGLVVQGDTAWDTIESYVNHVAPDLVGRLRRHVGLKDAFTEHRVDEQLAKALDRKVWLPSGGYLVIDRTEAMTVVDVNTGKFTGSGGNLEETVTRNNLESVEEIVRQLRLRDIGGIIVIDFIDMVLESNRDLVLRRLTECLGRDRTRHQVAEVTSLGLVQMTRKRVGTGLLEAYSTTCEHCRGRGVIVSTEPVGAVTGNGASGTAGAAAGNGTASHQHQHAAQAGAQANGAGGSDKQNGSAPAQSRRSRPRGKGNVALDTVAETAAQAMEQVAEAQAPVENSRENGDAPRQGRRQTKAEARAEAKAAREADAARAAEEARAAEPAGEPPAAEVVEKPAAEPARRNGHAVRTPAAAQETVVEPVAPAEPAATPAAAPARRQRRRAAARPAGPPKGSQTDNA
ncbi:ribonuclease, Rne/Rng family [Actinoalloteichus sp. GBA129-24]|uniref:Ribonuclease E n=2 Tax=Pseudonocardiaceae TaxID=2070 RepID=A0AAC9PR89_9PSEU|nr:MULTISPECIES: translation initiation factor IF-2 N-terminal domain-containing protein [Actinoalloteichus]APU13702.1 ribonuclease, Rne/Rng family [Actinoalloteichus fjordicus]APU19648.1 ribonuclease, Rne/Rng family [Actinoalloteichus sp. GBA129-24]